MLIAFEGGCKFSVKVFAVRDFCIFASVCCVNLQLSISRVQFCSSRGYLLRSIMQAAVVVILQRKDKKRTGTSYHKDMDRQDRSFSAFCFPKKESFKHTVCNSCHERSLFQNNENKSRSLMTQWSGVESLDSFILLLNRHHCRWKSVWLTYSDINSLNVSSRLSVSFLTLWLMFLQKLATDKTHRYLELKYGILCVSTLLATFGIMQGFPNFSARDPQNSKRLGAPTDPKGDI